MNQRAKKPGLWSASWCASCASWALSGSASAGIVLMCVSFPLRLILGHGGLVGHGLFDRSIVAGRRRRGLDGRSLRRRLDALGRATLGGEPGIEGRFRNHFDSDRHEAVARAAQFAAL